MFFRYFFTAAAAVLLVNPVCAQRDPSFLPDTLHFYTPEVTEISSPSDISGIELAHFENEGLWVYEVEADGPVYMAVLSDGKKYSAFSLLAYSKGEYATGKVLMEEVSLGKAAPHCLLMWWSQEGYRNGFEDGYEEFYEGFVIWDLERKVRIADLQTVEEYKFWENVMATDSATGEQYVEDSRVLEETCNNYELTGYADGKFELREFEGCEGDLPFTNFPPVVYEMVKGKEFMLKRGK